jgi:hypothetical protein
MRSKYGFRNYAAAFLLSFSATGTFAGPVILGGDDLTDHGSRTAGGVNLEGWKYIQLAIGNLLTNQTRAGAITSDVAALGSAANPSFSASNAGGAIGSAANVLGKTVAYFDGATAINQFFVDLVAGTINPRVIWIAGNGATNDVDSAEGAAITANASVINSFVAAGGGIMSHGSDSDVYGWLGALLPGLSDSGSCNSTGATLTAAGQAAFPSLTNGDVDANAGPCHSSFVGNFGGLVPLVLDGQGLPYIIGGGANTLIQCGDPGQPACPPQDVPVPQTLALIGIGLASALATRRRRLSSITT